MTVAVGTEFWSLVDKSDDCWAWTGGYISAQSHYGRYGKRVRAHRYAWEWHNGPIPEGLSVLHSCDNPPCVNPLHLFLGTQADNVHDMVRKGRAVNPMSTLTRCRSKGHPYDAATPVRVRASGLIVRECAACMRERRVKANERDRARRLEQGKIARPYRQIQRAETPDA